MEGYVQNFKVDMVDDKLKLKARIYRSQCKKEKLHLTDIHDSGKQHPRVLDVVILNRGKSYPESWISNAWQDQHC